jgi:hypothetical protein
MRSTSLLRLQYFREWPWPTKLPLKKGWFDHLSRTESIANESKQVFMAGDLAVAGVLLYCFWRVADDRLSGKHQSRLSHLTGLPPAIVAQDFDFTNTSKNRTVDRAVLDSYRSEFALARVERRSMESFIFNF